MFDNYADYYDLFNQDKPYKEEIDFVYRWAERPKTILDIGCGTANYWKYFPDGVEITGIENSNSMSERAGDHIIRGDIQKFKFKERFECATALFDVVNYTPKLDWFKNIPINSGGYFIFDIWNSERVEADGFCPTMKTVNGKTRVILPTPWPRQVFLDIYIYDGKKIFFEQHAMWIHSHEDIEKACGEDFKIESVIYTNRWQTWYKCRRK